MIEYPARCRSSQNACGRQSRQEQADRLCLFALPEPVRQVKDDTGIETSLRGAENEARDIKLSCILDEAGEYSHEAPRDQDAGDPRARAEPVQHQVAGD